MAKKSRGSAHPAKAAAGKASGRGACVKRAVADAVSDFVTSHAGEFEFIRENCKVRCVLSGQEFPPHRVEQLEAYVSSKAFLRAKQAVTAAAARALKTAAAKDVKGEVKEPKLVSAKGVVDTAQAGSADAFVPLAQIKLDLKFDYSKYEPHIVCHKKIKNALFCQLTGSCLNKIPAEVEKHVNGRRFIGAKSEFAEMVTKGGEVSDEEDEEEESDDGALDQIDFTPDAKRRRVEDDSNETVAPETATKQDQEMLLPPDQKLNKKARARLAAAKDEAAKKETASDRLKAVQAEAVAKANPADAKKEKTCKQKRKVNSKNRRIAKSKEENRVAK